MSDGPEHPAWWRHPIGWLRRWLLSGGCSACKSHEDDVQRWRHELDEQRRVKPETRNQNPEH